MAKLVVFGSFFVDLCGRGPYLPKPGETLIGSVFTNGPGGKGSNQAVAAKRAGADVEMITKIGDDHYGRIMLDFYEKEGIDSRHVFTDFENSTGIALILVDENSGENTILVVPGACHNITDEDLKKVEKTIADADLIIVQLEVNIDATIKVIDLAKRNNVKVIMNPAPAVKLQDEIYKMIDYITPNETEAEILTGLKTDTIENIKKAAKALYDKGVNNVLITLGKEGVYVKNDEYEKIIPSFKVKTVDTTGAGDAFNGCFASALLEGRNLIESAEFANAGAALSVTKHGTAPSMPKREEIDRFIKSF